MLKKIILLLCSVLLLGAGITCKLTETLEPLVENQVDASVPSARSVTSEKAKKLLGDGYDLFTANPSVKGMALDISEARELVGESKFMTEYEYSSDTYELDQKLNFGVDATCDVNLYNVVNASGSLTSDIITNSNCSSNTVTIIASVQYIHTEVFINGADLKPALRALFETNPAGFREVYGDGYVKKVQLGHKIYLLYQATLTNTSKYTKDELKTALEIKVRDILNLGVSAGDLEEMNEVMTYATVKSLAYGTGDFIPGLIENKQKFIDTYNAFVTYVTNCIAQYKASGDLTQFSALSKTYGAYEDFKYPAEDPTREYNYMRRWIKLRYQILTIREDTAPGLDYECENALELIDYEIKKCKEMSPAARAPQSGEFSSLEEAWLNKTGEKIYKLKFGAENYYYYISCRPEDVVAEVENLKKLKGKTCSYVQTPLAGGFTFSIAAKNTIPIYQLEDTDTRLSSFITSDINKNNNVDLNYAYAIPASGKILAYVSLNYPELIANINQVPFKTPPRNGSLTFTVAQSPAGFRLQDQYPGKDIRSVESITITVVGGGGGGSYGYSTMKNNGNYCYTGTLYPGAGGGAGGGIINKDIRAGFGEDIVYTIVVGSGGSRGLPPPYSGGWGTDGGTGGTSQFGTYIATGGNGGVHTTGGTAGTPVVGGNGGNGTGGGYGHTGTCGTSFPQTPVYGNGGTGPANGGNAQYFGCSGYVTVTWTVTLEP